MHYCGAHAMTHAYIYHSDGRRVERRIECHADATSARLSTTSTGEDKKVASAWSVMMMGSADSDVYPPRSVQPPGRMPMARGGLFAAEATIATDVAAVSIAVVAFPAQA